MVPASWKHLFLMELLRRAIKLSLTETKRARSRKKDHKTALMAILVHLSILIAYKFVAVVVVLGFCTLLYLLFLSS